MHPRPGGTTRCQAPRALGRNEVVKMNISAFLSVSVIVLTASAVAAQPYEVERLCDGPILSQAQFQAVGADDGEGANLNGPTLVRLPGWLEPSRRADPTARYYLYFAHHKGDYIRLAWASELCGPWRLYRIGSGIEIGGRGVLDLGPDDEIALDNRLTIYDHIASPEVVVDDQHRRFILYFHGRASHDGRAMGQKTFVATSADGLAFKGSVQPVALGNSYFRVFRHHGQLYAISNSGLLYRAPDAESPWTPPEGFDFGGELWIRRCDPLHGVEFVGVPMLPRHSWVRPQGDVLEIFFTRVGDTPERILVARVAARQPDFEEWRPESASYELLRAELEWEGADIQPAPSAFDWAPERVNQLRDPFVFEEGGRLYLLYTGAAEAAIGLAALSRR
jgi:hypothetical protein